MTNTEGRCHCDIKTGYIDGDDDVVRCIKCNGVIDHTTNINLATINKWNREFNEMLHYGHEGLDVRGEHEIYCQECEEYV